jgi:hypothetical protein
MVVEVSTNLYASNLELGTIPPGFVHQLGRSRWVIDTEVFQTVTTDGHLKKPSVHQGRGQALIVLTMIRVLAFTLTLVFFHRQIRSHLRSEVVPSVFAVWLTGWRIGFSLPLGRIPVESQLQLKPSVPACGCFYYFLFGHPRPSLAASSTAPSLLQNAPTSPYESNPH